MNRFFHVCIWFLVAVLAFGPVVESAHAMDAQLGQMFNSFGLLSATSPPGAYQGQTRNAYTGGSLEMRFQNQQMSLFSISPPRLSVGCGGIDAYLGGFSYGSLSRYVTLLTQLGTGAVLGYAFQLAMKFICPDCADVLNKLEAAARAMNTLGRINPCNAAASVQAALKAGEALKSVATSAGNAYETSLINAGSIRDPIDQGDTRAGTLLSTVKTDMEALGTPIHANLVWKALGQAVPPVDIPVRKLIMSLFGTIVVDNNAIPHYHPPTLEFKDIMQTRALETPTILTCLDNEVDCLDVSEGPSAGDLSGFEERTETSLQDIATAMATGNPPTAAQQNFINASSLPVWKLLLDHGKTAADRDIIVRFGSQIIATDLTFYYISYLRREVVKHVLHFKKLNPDFIGDAEQYLARLDETYRTVVAEVTTRNAGTEKSRQMLAYFFERPQSKPSR
jgi:conjugative transfer pilus assembly protein TraH